MADMTTPTSQDAVSNHNFGTPRILCLNEAGYATARRVAERFGVPVEGRAGRVAEADIFFDDALAHVRDLFVAGQPILAVAATGILIRAVAPVLSDKTTEPPLVAISADGTTIPLLGGHRGANRLAAEAAKALQSRAALTTGGEVALGLALDEPPPGWRLANPDGAKTVMGDLLSGRGVRLCGDEAEKAHWLKDLPQGDVEIAVTMDPAPAPIGGLLYRPLRATLGVGCSRNCPPDELAALVARTLEDAELDASALAAIGTVDLKADEPAILELASTLNLPLRFFTPAELEAETPNLMTPSDVVFAEIGCHGVSEAAALALTGDEGGLWVAKQKTANATCALGISPQPITSLTGKQRGRVSLVGIGPGQSDWRTPEASKLIAGADLLIGYSLYIDLIGAPAAGKPRADFGLGEEEARCRHALEEAAKGKDVALICSGDAGIYAMGALVFELLSRDDISDAARRVEVVTAPGISALQAAAARSGALLGHDFCTISLSDLLTPREAILGRLEAAAKGDFVVAFYNPVSKRRRDLLDIARDTLLEHRPAETPVVLARSLGRPDETITHRTLATLNTEEVDMMTVVLVGSSQSRRIERGDGTAVFTPRGYAKKMS